METALIIAALVGCLPSVIYLAFHVFNRIRWRMRRVLPYEGATQMILVAVAIFCFGCSLFLLFWNLAAPPPYYHLEKSLIIAFLFLLMGIFCLQVLQFIRWQNRQQGPAIRVSARPGREAIKSELRAHTWSQTARPDNPPVGYAKTHGLVHNTWRR